MRFYTYRQMNCYGAYETALELGIGLNVIIEAADAKAANEKARELGLFLDSGCDWCDRWTSRDEKYDDEGTIVPSTSCGLPIWAKVNAHHSYQLPSFIHWANGEITKIDHPAGGWNDPPAFNLVPTGWMQIYNEIERHKLKQGAA